MIVVKAILFLFVMAVGAFGQRMMGTRMNSPAPLRNPAARNAVQRGGVAYPLLFDGFYGGFGYPSYPPAANVIVVAQPAPAIPSYIAAQEPAPTAARMEIHEYRPPSPEVESSVFTIRLKDGSNLSASAVTVQNDALHYVDPDGRHARVPLDAVDRTATRRINRERNLNLRLPAPGR